MHKPQSRTPAEEETLAAARVVARYSAPMQYAIIGDALRMLRRAITDLDIEEANESRILARSMQAAIRAARKPKASVG